MKAPEDKGVVLVRYKEGPALLERALADITDADLDAAPSQGGWTIRQIVHHVVDGDDIWKICLKMALGNEGAEFTLGWYWAFPQEVWAERWAYAHRSVDVSLDLLKANRHHVLQLLEHIPNAWLRTVAFRKHNGEVECVPIGAAIEIQADHLEHHVSRILAIRKELQGVKPPVG